MNKTTNDYTYFPPTKIWQVAFGRPAFVVTVLMAISKMSFQFLSDWPLLSDFPGNKPSGPLTAVPPVTESSLSLTWPDNNMQRTIWNRNPIMANHEVSMTAHSNQVTL